jgi:5-methyltetrahydrofolate--homocysteine methyltransferase
MNLLTAISNSSVFISDGAMGTNLQSSGLEAGGCPESFNLLCPEIVTNIAKSFFDAGSQMVLANTFGANRFMLKKYGYENKVGEFNALAIKNASMFKPDNGFVVGSVGPTGKILQSNGGLTEDAEILDVFTEQTTELYKAGADGIVIETMISTEEACLAIKATKATSNLPVFTTMMFDKGPRGWFTMMGDPPTKAISKLENAGADAVGANCGNGINAMVELAQLVRDSTQKNTLIHSNAGMPSMHKNKLIYLESPQYMAKGFLKMKNIGINILGGCCGTTPEHINALSKKLKIS